MIHRVQALSLSEVNRILELIQKDVKPSTTVTTTNPVTLIATQKTVATTTTPSTPSIVDPGTTTSSNLLTGAMIFPEVLLAPDGSVLTDENGYALIGVRVESQVITGASDTIQAMSDSSTGSSTA